MTHLITPTSNRIWGCNADTLPCWCEVLCHLSCLHNLITSNRGSHQGHGHGQMVNAKKGRLLGKRGDISGPCAWRHTGIRGLVKICKVLIGLDPNYSLQVHLLWVDFPDHPALALVSPRPQAFSIYPLTWSFVSLQSCPVATFPISVDSDCKGVEHGISYFPQDHLGAGSNAESHPSSRGSPYCGSWFMLWAAREMEIEGGLQTDRTGLKFCSFLNKLCSFHLFDLQFS